MALTFVGMLFPLFFLVMTLLSVKSEAMEDKEAIQALVITLLFVGSGIMIGVGASMP